MNRVRPASAEKDMNMSTANAYDDYLQSIRAGWSEQQAIEHACSCWSVQESDLRSYIATFA